MITARPPCTQVGFVCGRRGTLGCCNSKVPLCGPGPWAVVEGPVRVYFLKESRGRGKWCSLPCLETQAPCLCQGTKGLCAACSRSRGLPRWGSRERKRRGQAPCITKGMLVAPWLGLAPCGSSQGEMEGQTLLLLWLKTSHSLTLLCCTSHTRSCRHHCGQRGWSPVCSW